MIAPSAAARKSDTELRLVAYSTPREAYAQLIPMFQKTAAGKDVSFSQSYGSSGEQARAVKAGLDADVVALSLAPDVDELVKADLVFKGWTKKPYKGMVTNSLVVFILRDGNPKKIRTWTDLLKPGVEVVTPNPFTSGGARWNVMAAYGAWRREGKTDKQAQANLLRLFKNVVVQDKSARDSLNTFMSGKGDVLLAYENEALFSKLKGLDIQYVIPRSTILIENPIAVTRTTDAREAGERVREVPDDAGRAAGVRQRTATGRSSRRCSRRTARSSPPARVSSRSTRSRSAAGRRRRSSFFDPKTGIMVKIENAVGGDTG